MTQEQQVIEAMRAEGGFVTLRRLNEILDFSSWGTKTPEASTLSNEATAFSKSGQDCGHWKNTGYRYSSVSNSPRGMRGAKKHSATDIIKGFWPKSETP